MAWFLKMLMSVGSLQSHSDMVVSVEYNSSLIPRLPHSGYIFTFQGGLEMRLVQQLNFVIHS